MPTPNGGVDEHTHALRFKWFRRMLGHVEPGRMIDLGAGHGKFAIDAADRGWKVTAHDARGDRFPVDDRITWEVGDVRDVDLGGYDLIACLGLFYHLTLDDQLSLLDRASGTPLILDTHVANGARSPMDHKLSEVVTVQGYAGVHYREPDQAKHSTASWGNEHSFWPRPQALFRMLEERGYDVLVARPFYLPTRTFFLCLPENS
ncbi:bifunctional 2-polyprenyl-6-hydroxyphenol methylase/3-demethylubiquinol 3-O-methyltransferase UbiG [Nocardioides sp. SYSU D00038]|uniref:class I SAM-dependent methyltransferase n=1 Tax=Nocardioides sp. SYSU D00038 TaxID=2812554 RepID=UPI0019680545|nr:class I SAM-dependent methyltransferase [Nocardioides sp. SYSU D00038]